MADAVHKEATLFRSSSHRKDLQVDTGGFEAETGYPLHVVSCCATID